MRRREDQRYLTGQGRYTADWNLPGQLHAYVLRADRAHAGILGLDVEVARNRPGVRLVLTGREFADSGWKSLPGGVAYEGIGGRKMRKPFWPALARDRVHYLGQPLALVVADSAAIAQDASEHIAIEYDELAPVIGFAQATRPGAPQLHGEAPGNIAFEYETGDRAAVESAFAKAALRTRLTVHSQRLIGSPIEPRAFLAQWDAASGTFTVYTPSQGINGMRAQLAGVTDLPPEKIRIITQDVGGSFGGRSFAYAEHLAVMLAARTLGRPVKWVATRSELFLSENHGRALTLSGELALDGEGRFLALRFEDCADIGAYATPFGAQIGSRNITITMGGVYRIPAMYARTCVAYTSVMQGVGQALGERAIYDSETGQLLTGSFLDYPMPRADWMQGIRCGEHNVPTQSNALGAKGIGESGTSGALPAVMNAVMSAVRPLGVTHLDMPVTPDRLWRALRDAGADRGGGEG